MSVSCFQTIHLATDHAGFMHKEKIYAWLVGEGFTVVDHGAYELDQADDFPAVIKEASQAVVSGGLGHAGIIFGGSGQGEAIVANRLVGIRAGVYYGYSDDIVILTRQHNDANMLSIGARFVSLAETKRIIWLWLHTNFSDDKKYTRRNQQLDTK